jgi:triosephosphate isomerase
MESQKKYIIGGNWKSNGSVSSIKDLVKDVLNKANFSEDRLEVVVTPISIHIASVKAMINGNI